MDRLLRTWYHPETGEVVYAVNVSDEDDIALIDECDGLPVIDDYAPPGAFYIDLDTLSKRPLQLAPGNWRDLVGPCSVQVDDQLYEFADGELVDIQFTYPGTYTLVVRAARYQAHQYTEVVR